MPEYRLVRGMKDLVGEEARKYNFIVQTAQKIAKEFNFSNLTTPIVEYSQLFNRLGDESDVVKKELYTFADKGGDMVALRPEFTAGVARYVIENGLFQGPFPRKFFSYGPVFRYDRPQKGRYRQFNQLNFEIFGLPNMAQEISAYFEMLESFFEAIGIKNYKIEINYLGESEERKNYIEALKNYLQQFEKDLSEDSQRRLHTNVLRILDSKDEGDKKILQNAQKIIDFLTTEHRAFLENLAKKYPINNNLVRGLDYYSGLVFEIAVVDEKLGVQQNSICGGGEYNYLIQEMCGKQLNAFGFAMGIERLMELVPDDIVPTEAPLYCITTPKANKVSGARNEILYFDDFVKGLKWANKLGADFIIFEKDGQLYQKNLKTGEQVEYK